MKILMFSGGLDSTYLAWRLLTNNDDPDGVHLHYVSMRNDCEGIWKKEDIATEKIVSYFKIHNYKFIYSKSKFEFFGQASCGWTSDLLMIVAQKVALNSYGHNIDVLLGWTPYDMEQQAVKERWERKVTQNIWKSAVQSLSNRQYVNEELQLPLVKWGITKDMMVKEIPKELFDLTWSCRTNNYIPCGQCHSCIERKKYEVFNINH
jgi:tRNA(Ile)-lysidine synthase TilS/MesJ